MTLFDLDLFYGHVIFCIKVFSKKNVKTEDFSETIAAGDLKGVRCGQLIKLMNICEYFRSRSFVQDHLLIKIETCFSKKPLGHFQPDFVCKLLGKMK